MNIKFKNKNLFKIISLFIAIITVFAAFPSFSGYAEETTSAEVAPGMWEVLDYIGVVGDTSEMELENTVSRGEFAVYAARAVGINEYDNIEDVYYTDVDSKSSYYAAVNYLAGMGILSVPEDRKFNPDDKISSEEAMKIMVCLIGGGDLASKTGGYPAGYRRVANDREILTGITTSSEITMNTMFRMIFNTINAEMYSVIAIKKDGDKHYTVRGFDEETILSVYWDIYDSEGVVDGAEEVTLNETQNLGKGEISIDGLIYRLLTNENTATKLGSYSEFYFRYNTETKEREILYIGEGNGKKSSLEINADDFNGYGDYKISYYKNDKICSQNIEAKTIVVYNGEVISENIDKAIKLSQGYMTLFDRDNNSQYDSLVIWDYINTVVSSISTDGTKIFDKYTGDKSIDIESVESDNVRFYMPDGSVTDVSSVTRDSVLTAYVSENTAHIYINNPNITGICKTVYDEYVLIDDTKYQLDNYIKENIKQIVQTGNKYVFYLDKFGKIAAVAGADGISDMTIGYIVAVSYGDGFIQDTLIRLYNKENGLVNLKVSDKLFIDGVKCSGKNTINAALLKGNYTMTNPTANAQLVRYKLDSDKCITKIDTKYFDAEHEDEKNTLFLSSGYAERSWLTYQNMLGETIVCDGTTLFLGVPQDDELSGSDKRDYVAANISYFKNITGPYSGRFRCESYTIGNDKGFADIVVSKGPLNPTGSMDVGTSDPIYMVDEVMTALNSEGEVVEAVKVYDQKTPVMIYAAEGDDLFTRKGVKSGDLIATRRDYYGTAYDLVIYYSYDEKNEFPTWKTRGGFSWNAFLSRGYVVDVTENILKIGYDDCETINEASRVFDNTVVLYYSNNKNGRADSHVTVKDVSSLIPYTKSDINGCSKVFAYRLHTVPKCLYVYER